MTEHILLIDDDERLARMVGEYLRQSSYIVTHAPTAAEGINRLASNTVGSSTVDLIVLDLMLPDMDGLEVCRRIRGLAGDAKRTPVLMLTAKGDPMDRVLGLEMGADDYLPKPFEPRELLARIRAILRRSSEPALSAASSSSSALHKAPLLFGALEINPDRRQAHLSGTLCDLTSYQFDLLLAMAERAGRVLSRDQIMEAVRGRELEAFDRSIDVHIGRIRQTIESDSKNPQRILTVRGVGYVFAKQQR
jgi:DNA-binding response OmpR family regulator